MSPDRLDPSDRRPVRRRVALLGFGEFERDALASYFRLAGQRVASGTVFHYRAGRDLARCDLIVAMSDQAAAVRTVVDAGREADTVFVGQHRPEGAGAWMARPIEPTRIVRELEGLAAQHQLIITVPAALDEARRERHERSERTAAVVDLDPTEAPPPVMRPPRRAVVAEAAAGALHALGEQLRERGYVVETLASGEAAVTTVAAAACDLVFLDAALGADGALDGFEACQRLRALPRDDGPKLVVVGSAQADRVRAMLAGCDAYLAAPLAADALDGLLRGLEPASGAALRPRGRTRPR